MPKRQLPKKDPPEVLRYRERLIPKDNTVLEFDDPSIPEQWDMCFVCIEANMTAKYVTEGWVPVDAKKDGIRAPFAVGNKSGSTIHNGDTVLYKRPKSIGDQEREDQVAMQRYMIQNLHQSNQDIARQIGVKDLKETLEVDGATTESMEAPIEE
jgi:hypothetical protein